MFHPVYPELVALVGARVPDYRGIFLRGHGSQTSTHYGTVAHTSAGLGQLQGDAIRNMKGRVVANPARRGSSPTGPFYDSGEGWNNHTDTGSSGTIWFDASRATPTAQEIRRACRDHWEDATHEHIVQPGLVYLSQPTEEGTLYTLSELEEIRKACDEYRLPLYIDGARCGYGLGAAENDVTLADLARLANVLYIGGTKVGALFGEAVVIPDPAIQKDFRYMIKRMGGMLAKGRLLGIQFEVLFQDGLYEQLGRRTVALAQKLAAAFEAKGISMLHKSPTNQQFPILTQAQRDKLGEKYAFSFWQAMDEDRAAVRFCTSWATREEDVDALVADIHNL